MKRAILLAVGLAPAATLLGATGCDSNDIDPMERQPKFRAYAESPLYSDDRAMRLPPDGTIARERIVDPAIGQGVGADGRPVDRIPVPVTMELLERGRNRFDIYCAVCHGVAGDGDSVVATKMSLRTPPSLHTDVIRALSPGQVFRVITDGYGLMTPYKAELPESGNVHDRWAVVAYVKALELSQHSRAGGAATPTPAPATPTPNPPAAPGAAPAPAPAPAQPEGKSQP